MNNYNFLEKLLHQISLSSKLIREVSFDVENSLISSPDFEDNHIFICGLARSGTTILLNSLYQSDIFASLTYEDMPFILSPNLWSRVYLNSKNTDLKERVHGDGIKFSTKSPEAFEEVFWKTFDDHEDESFQNFRIYINNIIYKYNRKRYLSKNNQNIRRVEQISDFFPHSKILIPFRDPFQHSYSLLSQHKKFIDYSKSDKFLAKYMKWIGHTEFGPNYIPINKHNLIFKNDYNINHWMEQWYLCYSKCLRTLINKNNVVFVCYEKLCSSENYWFDILNMVGIKNKYQFSFRESYKEPLLEVDSELNTKALSFYKKLTELC